MRNHVCRNGCGRPVDALYGYCTVCFISLPFLLRETLITYDELSPELEISVSNQTAWLPVLRYVLAIEDQEMLRSLMAQAQQIMEGYV